MRMKAAVPRGASPQVATSCPVEGAGRGDVGCWWLLPRQQASCSSFCLFISLVCAARDLALPAPAAASPSVLISLTCFCSPSPPLTPSPPGIPALAGQGAGLQRPDRVPGRPGLWAHAQTGQPNKVVFLWVRVLQFSLYFAFYIVRYIYLREKAFKFSPVRWLKTWRWRPRKMRHSCPVTQVRLGWPHTGPVPHPSGAIQSLIVFLNHSLGLPQTACQCCEHLPSSPCALTSARGCWAAHSPVPADVTPGLSPPFLICVLSRVLNTALPMTLDFQLLAGSKSPKGIKRHILSDLLWSPRPIGLSRGHSANDSTLAVVRQSYVFASELLHTRFSGNRPLGASGCHKVAL